MALNIKNAAVEHLVDEIVAVTGETRTEAVRRALEQRRDALSLRMVGASPARRLRRFLETEVWPLVPATERGRQWSREEQDALLGYGPDGT